MRLTMWSINQKYVAAMIATVCTIVFTQYLYAQNTNNSPNMPASTSGRNICEFLAPNGRFDLEAARRTCFQGSLNVNGFESGIDAATGQHFFRTAAKASTAGHPDDIYWDNSMSSSLPGVNWYVVALTVYDGKLIAGGYFTTAGGVEANGIAAWDGASWSPLGSLVNNYVRALTVYNGKLIAGGGKNIDAWDGSSWSPLGSWYNNDVNALTVYDGKLIAGGFFTIVWDVVPNRIAAWDGSSWSPLGSGIGGWVYALTVYDGKLIAGGVGSSILRAGLKPII